MPELTRPEPTGKSKAEVFRIAEGFAEEVGFLPGDRIEPLVGRIGGVLRYRDPWDLANSAKDGSLMVFGQGAFEIVLASHTGIERDRFTIAHELGHYVLHSRQGEIQIEAARYGSSPVEWEANWFAAAFLMPAADFRNSVRRYRWNMSAVASRYLVSVRAAEVRAQSLSLGPQGV